MNIFPMQTYVSTRMNITNNIIIIILDTHAAANKTTAVRPTKPL